MFNIKGAIYTLSMTLAAHVNNQKVVKICIDMPYCVSNAIEIRDVIWSRNGHPDIRIKQIEI
jgi:hypothetical protein